MHLVASTFKPAVHNLPKIIISYYMVLDNLSFLNTNIPLIYVLTP